MNDLTKQIATFWDSRYEGEAFTYGEAPNAYLAAQAARLTAGGRAIVPGDGEGRNGVWLAQQGLQVKTLDLSPRGVDKARALAAKMGVSMDAEIGDVLAHDWASEQLDVVALIFLHMPPPDRKKLHAAVQSGLKPGGLIVIEAFTPDQIAYQKSHQSGGPGEPAMLFTEEMLIADFDQCDVLDLSSGETQLAEGLKHKGLASTVRGVFRKRMEA
ncbi:MAG: class I SAM-dependent methyltransferase [Pseudomonadota bacterium]